MSNRSEDQGLRDVSQAEHQVTGRDGAERGGVGGGGGGGKETGSCWGGNKQVCHGYGWVGASEQGGRISSRIERPEVLEGRSPVRGPVGTERRTETEKPTTPKSWEGDRFWQDTVRFGGI